MSRTEHWTTYLGVYLWKKMDSLSISSWGCSFHGHIGMTTGLPAVTWSEPLTSIRNMVLVVTMVDSIVPSWRSLTSILCCEEYSRCIKILDYLLHCDEEWKGRTIVSIFVLTCNFVLLTWGMLVYRQKNKYTDIIFRISLIKECSLTREWDMVSSHNKARRYGFAALTLANKTGQLQKSIISWNVIICTALTYEMHFVHFSSITTWIVHVEQIVHSFWIQ